MRRFLLAGGVGLLLVPASASAATDRNVQAFDQPTGFAPVWTPNNITAQPGDTVTWHFDEPGNPNVPDGGANHDLYLIRPGQADERLGASFLAPTVQATLDTEGTYTFYCSIHKDTMRGTITVAAGDATPAVDPGRPWDSPAPPIVVETAGPPALLNSASPLTVLESGDLEAPTLKLAKVAVKGRSARLRVAVSKPGTVYARVLKGKRTVSTAHFKVAAGSSTVKVKLPKRRARYRLAVWVRDAARLESRWSYKTVR